MNVCGNPLTPVTIDQVGEIRFQRQANSFGSKRTWRGDFSAHYYYSSASIVSGENSLMFPVRCRDVHIREVPL